MHDDLAERQQQYFYSHSAVSDTIHASHTCGAQKVPVILKSPTTGLFVFKILCITTTTNTNAYQQDWKQLLLVIPAERQTEKQQWNQIGNFRGIDDNKQKSRSNYY